LLFLSPLFEQFWIHGRVLGLACGAPGEVWRFVETKL
jgi:hypothetical protein